MFYRYKVTTRNNKSIPVHRLVWERANGPIPEGYEIHHINGDGHDNRLENLICLSPLEHKQLHARLRKEGIALKSDNDPNVREYRDFMNRYMRAHPEIRKAWVKANPDKVSEAQKRYKLGHAEELKEKGRQYYHAHKEKRLKAASEWSRANPEKERARHKRYSEMHPEFVAQQNAKKREYSKIHSAEILAKKKEYYAEHREEILARRAAADEVRKPLYAAKARLKRAISNNYSEEEIQKRKHDVEIELSKLNGQ